MAWPNASYPMLLAIGILIQSWWIAAGMAGMALWWDRWFRSASVRYFLGLAALLLVAVLPVVAGWVIHGSMFSESVVAEASRRGVVASEWVGLVSRYGNRAAGVLFWVWAAGVVVCLGRLLGGGLGLRRRLRASTGSLRGEKLLAEVGTDLPQLVIRESNRAGSPFVAGFARPVLVLPRWLFDELGRDELISVVRHELAHVARHDFIVNLAQRVVESIGWFNPALLLLSRRARAIREECCDDAAVAAGCHPLAMARALIRLEESRPDRIALAAGFGGSGQLGSRIHRLVAPGHRGRTSRRFAAVAVTAAVGCGMALGVVATGDRAGMVMRWSMPVATVHAIDPAGPFSIAMLGGRILSARMPDGQPRVIQQGRRARLVDERGATVIALTTEVGGFHWEPRMPSTVRAEEWR